jgi:hypothetical protein
VRAVAGLIAAAEWAPSAYRTSARLTCFLLLRAHRKPRFHRATSHWRP